jgi:hypothetical protein
MKKILILSSNPRRDLNLDREISDLSNAVQRLEKFEIRLGLGVRSQELAELLAEHSPEIVHFCGHGAGEKGLVFQDENGQEQLVSTEILTRIFKTFSEEINCTVLNACDSDRQAQAIVEHINYVVGMSQPILDKAAHLFSVGFYKGLAAGKSIEQAYEMGCIAIQIWSETNAQSIQTRQYRKLEYAGDVIQPAQSQMAEYLKPVLLKKSERFPSSLTGIGLVSGVLPASVPSEPLQRFVEYVQQEIDRKEYKDSARDAYDNFGQFSDQKVTSLSKSETKQRKILLGKVKQFWIEGFLQPSLQGVSALSLDLKSRPDAIANLTQGIEALSVELDASYEKLRETKIYEEIGQGLTLLILGSPGAGKTIALLQLAQRLIERSKLNLSLPIPVVFNLSSWARDRKSIVDWLIDELQEKYQSPKALSEPWITQQQLILLLDGLDEVEEDHRNDCVRALNEFIGLFPQTEVAVCSRVKDYEALTERLQISSALCLQPLSSEQIYQSLESVGGSLAGLKTLLKRDAELEKFAQTPLILNFMSVAYQGWSVEELMPQLRSTTNWPKHLFDTYIDRNLKRGASCNYPKNQILNWLSWLAKQLQRESRTVFLIEKIQPIDLQNIFLKIIYLLGIGTTYGFIVGLSASMCVRSLLFDLDEQILWGLLGFLGGSIYAIGYSFFAQYNIQPASNLNWSWKNALIGSFLGATVGLILNVAIGLYYLLFFNQPIRLVSPHILVIIFSIIFFLIRGLSNSMIGETSYPNQEIWESAKNSIFFTLIGILGGMLTAFLYNESILAGVFLGLPFGLFRGAEACIQHFILRLLLYLNGAAPWNYAKFLDFASDRLLMKKIGGGYVFFHRMLLEHFARMKQG